VIYVNLNYRLGPLGFPQGSEAAANNALNLGLQDQLTALEWLHLNINTFGGDGTKVLPKSISHSDYVNELTS
jgi:acetylcholinesterase